MYIVAATFDNQGGDQTEEYFILEDLETAQAKYNELLEDSSTYTCQIGDIIQSTDPQHLD